MGNEIKKSLIECDQYKTTIMTSIKEVLDTNKISYTSNDSDTEIIASGSKGDIKKMMKENLNVPHDIVKMLIGYTGSNNDTFIRLKFN